MAKAVIRKGIETRAPGKDKQLIYQKVREYLQTLERSNVPVWRLYLYGSYAKDTYHADSDIDLAVFWDRDDIDGFDEDVLLRKLSCDVDLRIEPHSFARTDDRRTATSLLPRHMQGSRRRESLSPPTERHAVSKADPTGNIATVVFNNEITEQ
jgi:predicted nucleotidyltransferase